MINRPFIQGQNTKAFELHGKKPELEDRAFSIIYILKGEYKTLNLIAPTRQDAEWYTAIITLVGFLDVSYCLQNWIRKIYHRGSDRLIKKSLTNLLHKLWKEADLGDQGNLDQITALLRRLNVKLSKKEVK